MTGPGGASATLAQQPRLERLRTQVLPERVRAGQLPRPLLLEQFAADWPAVRSWNPAALRGRCGDLPVVVEHGRVLEPGWRRGRVTIRHLVDSLEAGAPLQQPLYLAQCPLTGELSGLRDDLDASTIDAFKHRSEVFLWVGSADSGTPLHYDNGHNLFIQAYGSKSFVLFSPEETPNLYRMPRLSKLGHFSRIDLTAVDHSRFPRFRSARAVEVTLRSGDALVLPRGWWHFVKSLEVSVSANLFWKTRAMLARDALLAPIKRRVRGKPASQVRVRVLGRELWL